MDPDETLDGRARSIVLASGGWGDVLAEAGEEPALLRAVVRLVLDGESVSHEEDWELEAALYDLGLPWLPLALAYGVERAQAIANELDATVDVAHVVDAHDRAVKARTAIALRGPDAMHAASDAMAELPEHDFVRYEIWDRAVRERPLSELVFADDLPASDLAILRAELRDSHAPYPTFVRLLEEGHERARVLAAIAAIWPERVAPDDVARDPVGATAAIFVEGGRPIGEVIALFDDAPLDLLLPALRPRGLRANRAALALYEREGLRPLAIARGLVDAGYDDESILEALRTNGFGEVGSLVALRDAGWSAERLTAALFERDVLLTEIRDRLTALGVDRARIAALLSAHASADRIALVLPAE